MPLKIFTGSGMRAASDHSTGTRTTDPGQELSSGYGHNILPHQN
jgi:hypothetical protein